MKHWHIIGKCTTGNAAWMVMNYFFLCVCPHVQINHRIWQHNVKSKKGAINQCTLKYLISIKVWFKNNIFILTERRNLSQYACTEVFILFKKKFSAVREFPYVINMYGHFNLSCHHFRRKFEDAVLLWIFILIFLIIFSSLDPDRMYFCLWVFWYKHIDATISSYISFVSWRWTVSIKKTEYTTKITDLPLVPDKLYHIMLYQRDSNSQL